MKRQKRTLLDGAKGDEREELACAGKAPCCIALNRIVPCPLNSARRIVSVEYTFLSLFMLHRTPSASKHCRDSAASVCAKLQGLDQSAASIFAKLQGLVSIYLWRSFIREPGNW